MDTIRTMYKNIVVEACERAVALEFPGIVIEFETLIEMTLNPEYAIELTKIINEVLEDYYKKRIKIRTTHNPKRHKRKNEAAH